MNQQTAMGASLRVLTCFRLMEAMLVSVCTGRLRLLLLQVLPGGGQCIQRRALLPYVWSMLAHARQVLPLGV